MSSVAELAHRTKRIYVSNAIKNEVKQRLRHTGLSSKAAIEYCDCAVRILYAVGFIDRKGEEDYTGALHEDTVEALILLICCLRRDAEGIVDEKQRLRQAA